MILNKDQKTEIIVTSYGVSLRKILLNAFKLVLLNINKFYYGIDKVLILKRVEKC